MHSQRKTSILIFALGIGMVAFLVYACIQRPLPIFVLLLALFSGVTGLAALPAFFTTDRWFRFQERAGRRWERRYPRTAAVLAIIGFLCTIFELVRHFVR